MMSAPPRTSRSSETRVYRGANVWSYDKSIHLVVDLGARAVPDRHLPGFSDDLVAMLPGLREHSCSRGRRGGFVERLKRARGSGTSPSTWRSACSSWSGTTSAAARPAP
jgi:cyanophycin synthetase